MNAHDDVSSSRAASVAAQRDRSSWKSMHQLADGDRHAKVGKLRNVFPGLVVQRQPAVVCEHQNCHGLGAQAGRVFTGVSSQTSCAISSLATPFRLADTSTIVKWHTDRSRSVCLYQARALLSGISGESSCAVSIARPCAPLLFLYPPRAGEPKRFRVR